MKSLKNSLIILVLFLSSYLFSSFITWPKLKTKLGIVSVGLNGPNEILITRYVPAFEGLDWSFGKEGSVTLQPLAGLNIADLLLAEQQDGKILLAFAGQTEKERNIVGLARFNIDGSLDKSFSKIGYMAIELPVEDISLRNGIIRYNDGTIFLRATFLDPRTRVLKYVVIRIEAETGKSMGYKIFDIPPA